MNNHLLKTHMRVSEGEDSQRELAICLHPHKDKLLFLDRKYNGYFVDLSIISKFSFDTKFFYLKLGNKMLAFTRLPNGGTDEDYKGLIKELKNIKAEFKETDVCFASSYLDENKKSFGIVSEESLLASGVVFEEKTEEPTLTEKAPLQPKSTLKNTYEKVSEPSKCLENIHKASQESIDFADSIASFAKNKKASDELQKQIDALTDHLNKKTSYANESEEGHTVSNDGVILSVKDIMNEVQHLANEQSQENLNKIPEGFHIVREDAADYEVLRNMGTTKTFDKQEFIDAVETEMNKEEASEQTEEPEDEEEKGNNNLIQNIFIGLLIIVIVALLIAIGLMCTNNLDKLLDLFPFIGVAPTNLICQ